MSELEVKLTLAAEVQRLELRPGDKLALTVDSLLTYEQAVALKKRLEDVFPGHACVVLGRGMSLEVVSPELR
jgi:hypothetical protein